MNTSDRIRKCIKSVKGEYFTVEEKLVREGWLDSFEILKLIDAIETEFNMKISLQNVTTNNFDSIVDIEELVMEIGNVD